MVRRGCWIVLFALFCSVVRAAEVPAVPAVIQLASEEWEDYTAADGHGLAWDILREVFEPAGVKLKISTVPYTRSIGLAQRKEVDAMVGSYLDEVEGVLYPKSHFDCDHIHALGLATMPPPTLATLGKYQLAWVRGYRYDKYLPGIKNFTQIVRRKGILSMLRQGRADFYIDAQTEVDAVVREARDVKPYRSTHVAELPLYLGFADTPQARSLMALYDRRMALLVSSGKLKPIFERWQEPYPFEGSAKPAVE